MMKRIFAITLEFPDDHIKQTHQPMLVKMREYLISYIVYRWLENKIPEIAAVYLNKAEGALSGIKSLCEKRNLSFEKAWYVLLVMAIARTKE